MSPNWLGQVATDEVYHTHCELPNGDGQAMMWEYVKIAAQDVDELCRSPVDALSK
jgi:hypothetical protein